LWSEPTLTSERHNSCGASSHHAATLGDTPDDVQVLAAAFGRFGALPVLAVWFDEGYILIDGTNGAAAGPYADGVAYDPTELLLAHGVYQPGTGAIMVDLETGCESSGLAKRWRTNPPAAPLNPRPGFFPSGPWVSPPDPVLPTPNHFPTWPLTVPAARPPDYPPVVGPPPGPATPNQNRGRDGWPTDWSCTTPAADGSEVCGTLETWIDGNGNIVIRAVVCNLPAGRNPGGTAPNNGPPHLPRDYDSTNPDGMPKNQSPQNDNCEDQWYY
jgi:hypothetical protein